MQNSQREQGGRAISRNRELGETTRKTTQTMGIMDKRDNMGFFGKRSTSKHLYLSACENYADDRVTRPEIIDESGPSITSTEMKHAINK